MNEGRLNKALTIIYIAIFAIGMYHAYTFIRCDSDFMISLYHIAYNATILSLMLFILLEIRNVKRFKIHFKVIVTMSVYFICKIIINILYMFPFFVKFIDKYDMHIWSFILTLLIIISLGIIKFTKR